MICKCPSFTKNLQLRGTVPDFHRIPFLIQKRFAQHNRNHNYYTTLLMNIKFV